MKPFLIFLFLSLVFLNNCYCQMSDAVKYNEMGNAWFAKGKYNEAIVDYTRSLEIDPNYVTSFCNRGSAYYNLRQFDKAIEDFNKVIELEPTFHSGIAYAFRASSNFYMGKFDDAIRDYSLALEINPNDARIYNDRANVYYLQDNYDLAIKDYKKALELEPRGKAGKIAREKINFISKNSAKGKKHNQELLKRIDQLKNDWASELDNAGRAIAEKKFDQAHLHIKRSADMAKQLKAVLSMGHLSLDKADAMEKLSLTYENLNSLFTMLDGDGKEEIEVDLSKLRRLVFDSYEYLDSAQPQFKDAPLLEKICQEIRKGLDGISEQLEGFKE